MIKAQGSLRARLPRRTGRRPSRWVGRAPGLETRLEGEKPVQKHQLCVGSQAKSLDCTHPRGKQWPLRHSDSWFSRRPESLGMGTEMTDCLILLGSSEAQGNSHRAHEKA